MTDHTGSAEQDRVFEGVVTLTWYGNETAIGIGDDPIDEYLVGLEGRRVRVTVEIASA